MDEKRVWEIKAKHAKAEHKALYPDYRFRPVHNKNKEKKKDRPLVTPEDERRCEEVAQLLLEGKKGDELAAAVRDLDRGRSSDPPSPTPPLLSVPVQQYAFHRRSSSVPLPDYNPIALPSVPFLNAFRDDMPRYCSMSRASRIWLGQRRASSAQPIGAKSWTMPPPAFFHHRPHSPLPEPDVSLFDPAFLASSNFGFLPFQDSNLVRFTILLLHHP